MADKQVLDPKGIKVRRSPEFKLKDKANRNFVIIRLRDFGFLPEVIIIRKLMGQSNKFYVEAILTKDEMDKLAKKQKKHEEMKKKGGNQNEQSNTQPASV